MSESGRKGPDEDDNVVDLFPRARRTDSRLRQPKPGPRTPLHLVQPQPARIMTMSEAIDKGIKPTEALVLLMAGRLRPDDPGRRLGIKAEDFSKLRKVETDDSPDSIGSGTKEASLRAIEAAAIAHLLSNPRGSATTARANTPRNGISGDPDSSSVPDEAKSPYTSPQNTGAESDPPSTPDEKS